MKEWVLGCREGKEEYEAAEYIVVLPGGETELVFGWERSVGMLGSHLGWS